MNHARSAARVGGQSLPRPLPLRQLLVPTLAVVSTLLVLVLLRHDFWRPYNDTRQDSLASMHAHAFAIANWAGVGANPFVARDFDLATGQIHIYNHWPNGFFALFSVAIRLLGNTEMTGRTYAIAWILLGAWLAALGASNRYRLTLLATPLLLLTPMGRDAAPLVFLDAALFFWLGLMIFLLSRYTRSPRWRWLLRATLLIAPFFCQMILFYAFFLIVVAWLEHKDRRAFCADLCTWACSSVLVLLALSWTPNGIMASAQELFAQFLHRASIVERYPEAVSVRQLGSLLWHHLYRNLGLTVAIVPLCWLVLIVRRDWVLAALLPTSLAYSLTMRNYVGVHIFANLPLVFAGILTLLSGIERLFEPDLLRSHDWVPSSLVQAHRWVLCTRRRQALILAGTLAATSLVMTCSLQALSRGSLSLRQRYFQEDAEIVTARSAMEATLAGKQNGLLADQCSAFLFDGDADVEQRMAQYYLAEHIVGSIRSGQTGRVCQIDLAAGDIR